MKTTMCPSTTLSLPENKKRVRFQERVKIIEIEQIVHTLTEEMGHETTTDSDDHSFTRDESERTGTGLETSNLMYDVFSSCSSSNAHSTYNSLLRPVRKPNKIPSMLFNILPEVTESSSSSINYDRRWKGSDANRSHSFSSFAPSAPVRAPSIDQIIGTALAIVEGSPILQADAGPQEQQRNEALASRKNYSWDEYDFVITDSKRWKEDSQSPPKIPRRKISATSLEEAMRRKSWPGAGPRAGSSP